MRIGIVANAPKQLLPNLKRFTNEIDFWIGVDKGTLYLIEQHIRLDCAVGDFDSISEKEFVRIESHTKSIKKFQSEKNKKDMELEIKEKIINRPKNQYIIQYF